LLGTLKYYFYYYKNLLELGTINLFFNKKKFKDFSVVVNDFKSDYLLNEKSKYIKTIDLYDILKNTNENKITIDNWKFKQGNATLYELYCLSSIANYLKPQKIFEIGTFDGNTTLHLAVNTPEFTKIETLDLPPEQLEAASLRLDKGDSQLIDKKGFKIGQCFLSKDISKKITQHLSDSAKFDFSIYENKIDLFFVDGAHSFEYIESDTKNAFRCVKDTGIILWHDYGDIMDVTEFLNELSKSKPLFRINFTSIVVYSQSFSI